MIPIAMMREVLKLLEKLNKNRWKSTTSYTGTWEADVKMKKI